MPFSAKLATTLTLAVLAASCGQYQGVHREAPSPVEIQTAGHATTVPTTAPPSPSVASDDGVGGPGEGAISGDTTTLLGKLKDPSAGKGKDRKDTKGSKGDRKGGKKDDSSTRGDSSKKKGDDGASGPGDDATKGDISVPDSVQEVLQQGAQYNLRVLPKGFPFQICPVWGRFAYSDDYGAPRYAGGYHPHAGNDIFAEMGTPVLAPFNGYVEKAENTLGGLAVRVHGPLGYVYMAHLIAYSPKIRYPSSVVAGTVVGFVGNTGDAQGTSPHNHFEWHPLHPQSYDRQIDGANGAVDPFAYLRVVCPPS